MENTIITTTATATAIDTSYGAVPLQWATKTGREKCAHSAVGALSAPLSVRQQAAFDADLAKLRTGNFTQVCRDIVALMGQSELLAFCQKAELASSLPGIPEDVRKSFAGFSVTTKTITLDNGKTRKVKVASIPDGTWNKASALGLFNHILANWADTKGVKARFYRLVMAYSA